MRKRAEIRQIDTVSPDTWEITLDRGDSAWLNQILLQEGYKVSAIAPKQMTLKEFFLSITGVHSGPTEPRRPPRPLREQGIDDRNAPSGDEPHA